MRFHGTEVAVRLSTDKCLFVERVKCFARWHEDQFDVLDEPREPVANHAGWKRGGEYWIRPDIWRDTIFEGNEIASVEAARTLRDLGLLRVQDTRNFQAVVGVRNHKTVRAYVVKPEIREWKPTEPVYGIYGAPQIGLSSSQGNGSPALVPLPSDGQHPLLPALLSDGTRLSLQRAIEVLGASPDPGDRNFATILRAQTTIISTLLNAQLKVDETRLREKQRADGERQVLALLDAEIAKEAMRKAKELAK
jgi:hypothetical protein